jgi:ParB-like chromosome segregation protein Spo0J
MAYGRLHDNAATAEERERYRAIPARVKRDVTDAQMLLWALNENIQRSSLTPLEIALSLAELRRFYPGVKSAKDLSKLIGLGVPRVQRYLRLADGPAVVQSAAGEGVLTPVEMEPDDDRPANEQPTEQHRRLDLLEALEFVRLHDFLVKKFAAKKNAQELADSKTSEGIVRAIKGKWGFRQIQRFVEQSLGQDRPPTRGRPKEPFKRGRHQLVIYPARLSALSSSQRTALRQLLEPIWKLVDGAS